MKSYKEANFKRFLYRVVPGRTKKLGDIAVRDILGGGGFYYTVHKECKSFLRTILFYFVHQHLKLKMTKS